MNIPFEQMFFGFFSGLLLFSALMVIVSRHAVRSALFLVVAFLASSGLWMLLHAEFLALILVLVYVGAVMTLFLFVVMTLNLDKNPETEGFVRYLPYGILVSVLIATMMIYVIEHAPFAGITTENVVQLSANHSNVKDLGTVLYTHYAYPLELAGVLLLIAIVAAISLDLRIKTGKKQSINQQIAVNAKERVRLVK
jgi:NADH-quinone oxidoreductase subunit J